MTWSETDADGNWSWSPPSDLEPENTPDPRYTDDTGEQQLVTRTFIVQADTFPPLYRPLATTSQPTCSQSNPAAYAISQSFTFSKAISLTNLSELSGDLCRPTRHRFNRSLVAHGRVVVLVWWLGERLVDNETNESGALWLMAVLLWMTFSSRLKWTLVYRSTVKGAMEISRPSQRA